MRAISINEMQSFSLPPPPTIYVPLIPFCNSDQGLNPTALWLRTVCARKAGKAWENGGGDAVRGGGGTWSHVRSSLAAEVSASGTAAVELKDTRNRGFCKSMNLIIPECVTHADHRWGPLRVTL